MIFTTNKGTEPTCPKCKGGNALLHYNGNISKLGYHKSNLLCVDSKGILQDLKCRDCGTVFENATVIYKDWEKENMLREELDNLWKDYNEVSDIYSLKDISVKIDKKVRELEEL